MGETTVCKDLLFLGTAMVRRVGILKRTWNRGESCCREHGSGMNWEAVEREAIGVRENAEVCDNCLRGQID